MTIRLIVVEEIATAWGKAPFVVVTAMMTCHGQHQQQQQYRSSLCLSLLVAMLVLLSLPLQMLNHKCYLVEPFCDEESETFRTVSSMTTTTAVKFLHFSCCFCVVIIFGVGCFFATPPFYFFLFPLSSLRLPLWVAVSCKVGPSITIYFQFILYFFVYNY